MPAAQTLTAPKRPARTPAVESLITPAMRSAFDALIGAAGTQAFRQADVQQAMYRLTSPRSDAVAGKVAAALIKTAAKVGLVGCVGDLHYVKAATGKRTLNGRIVPEEASLTNLTLSTNFPGKWASIDLETGDVWSGAAEGWRRADEAARAEVKACLALDAASAELTELRALVRGILDQRSACFIPNDKEGLLNWDERASKVLGAS